MRYAGLNKNDFTNGEGICVSLFVQGCIRHCPGCFNPQTWDFNGGHEVPYDIKGEIIKAISANGIMRNFSILGGEPLCEPNAEFVLQIITAVRAAYPTIKIYLWTGYTLEELKEKHNDIIDKILDNITYLIDGPYVQELRDITLPLRGSSNQRIIKLDELKKL